MISNGPGSTRRVEVEANVSLVPGGQDYRFFTYEVTREVNDAYETTYTAELISGDIDDADDDALVDAENDALRTAQTRWDNEAGL